MASNSTIGTSSKPVYMSAGTITACTNVVGVPNYSGAYDILTSNGSFTAPSNGYIYIYTAGNGSYFNGTIGGLTVNTGGNFSNYHESDTSIYPVASGDVVVRTNANATIKFIPCK